MSAFLSNRQMSAWRWLHAVKAGALFQWYDPLSV